MKLVVIFSRKFKLLEFKYSKIMVPTYTYLLHNFLMKIIVMYSIIYLAENDLNSKFERKYLAACIRYDTLKTSAK